MTDKIKHMDKLLEISVLIYISLVSSSAKNSISYFTLDKSCVRQKHETKIKNKKQEENNKQLKGET